MAYFDTHPEDKIKLLHLICELTKDKAFTDRNEISFVWKRNGCGTGDFQSVLIKFLQNKLIETRDGDDAGWEGNTPFRLTQKGRDEFLPWYKKRENWKFIFSGMTTLATLGTFLYLLCSLFSEK